MSGISTSDWQGKFQIKELILYKGKVYKILNKFNIQNYIITDELFNMETVPKQELEENAKKITDISRPQGGKRSRRHRRTKSRKQKRSKKTRRRA